LFDLLIESRSWAFSGITIFFTQEVVLLYVIELVQYAAIHAGMFAAAFGHVLGLAGDFF
jgi:hypothetical protein